MHVPLYLILRQGTLSGISTNPENKPGEDRVLLPDPLQVYHGSKYLLLSFFFCDTSCDRPGPHSGILQTSDFHPQFALKKEVIQFEAFLREIRHSSRCSCTAESRRRNNVYVPSANRIYGNKESGVAMWIVADVREVSSSTFTQLIHIQPCKDTSWIAVRDIFSKRNRGEWTSHWRFSQGKLKHFQQFSKGDGSSEEEDDDVEIPTEEIPPTVWQSSMESTIMKQRKEHVTKLCSKKDVMEALRGAGYFFPQVLLELIGDYLSLFTGTDMWENYPRIRSDLGLDEQHNQDYCDVWNVRKKDSDVMIRPRSPSIVFLVIGFFLCGIFFSSRFKP
jgi:hypothetical protein